MMKLFPAVVLLAVVLLTQDLYGAEVRGQVLDMEGKPIVHAKVVYVNVDNGLTYRLETGPDGRFLRVGVTFGTYNVLITGPDGKRIYSSVKKVSPPDFHGEAVLNVIRIDLSIIPTKVSLVPFKGPKAAEIQGEKWRQLTEDNLRYLSPEQTAELREENAAIVRYNELTPESQAAIKNQDWPQAAKMLQQLIAIAPYKWELYQNLGTIQRNIEQYKDAIASFEKALQVIQFDADTQKDRNKLRAAQGALFMGMGEAYFGLDDLHASAAQFRKAAELSLNPALAYIHLCSAEYNGGNADAALDACHRAIKADPTQLEFYLVLAGVQSNLEKYADAIQTYEQGIHVSQARVKMDRSVHSNINSGQGVGISQTTRDKWQVAQMAFAEGNAYFALKKYKEAADRFRSAAGMHPAPGLAYFNLCAALYDLNDFAGAAAACDRAIVAEPGLADAYFVKASAGYGMAGQHGKFAPPHDAVAALKKYLELEPDGPYADQARAMLQEAAIKN